LIGFGLIGLSDLGTIEPNQSGLGTNHFSNHNSGAGSLEAIDQIRSVNQSRSNENISL